MVRAKTSAKQKTTTPIPFPHDGPLSKQHENTPSDDIQRIHIDSDVAKCAKNWAKKILVWSRLDAVDYDVSETIDERTTSIVHLCRSFRSTNITSKEQLNNMQIFRNDLLQTARKQQPLLLEDTTQSVWGLYQLLLEWSLSRQTPLPFQRAIQSLLKTLGESFDSGDVKTKILGAVVLYSLFEDTSNQFWEDPMRSLDIAVSWETSLIQLQQEPLLSDCLRFLLQSKIVSKVLTRGVKEKEITLSFVETEEVLQVAGILKDLLTLSNDGVCPQSVPEKSLLSEFQQLQEFVSVLLTCSTMPSDSFNTLGILYGNLWLLRSYIGNESRSEFLHLALANKCHAEITELHCNEHSKMSSLARLSVVQGISATLPDTVLTLRHRDSYNKLLISPLELCWRYSLDAGKGSTDPLVRWASLKGLTTLVGRWRQQPAELSDSSETLESIRGIIDETIELIFDSWENPPIRKMGTALPGLFKAIVRILPEGEIPGLFQLVLQQPVNRKGRYLALGILLPYMDNSGGFNGRLSTESKSFFQLEALLDGIGDQGQNAGAIADLWVKILKLVWEDLSHATERNGSDFAQKSFDDWNSYWVPTFCAAVTAEKLVRRKQILAFCLPRVVELMRGIKQLRVLIPDTFCCVLEQILEKANGNQAIPFTGCENGTIIWALLEVSWYAASMNVTSRELLNAIGSSLPIQTLQNALVHASSSIRLSAFKAMQPVVASYSSSDDIQIEIELWKEALPFSIFSDESKEYRSTLLQTLCLFLDRLCLCDSDASRTEDSLDLPRLRKFCIDFLVNEIFLARGAYPGAIASKVSFSIAILDCVLVFSLRDKRFCNDNIFPQNGMIFTRKTGQGIDFTIQDILLVLQHEEVLSALFAALHSIWDHNRTSSYHFLIKLMQASQSRGILRFSHGFFAKEQQDFMYARGLYLASSPRQREADTGSRVLAVLYASFSESTEKRLFFRSLIELCKHRVDSMKTVTAILLSGKFPSHSIVFPLAHGLIHALHLCLKQGESTQLLCGEEMEHPDHELNQWMIEIFCHALRLSLSVVADIREGDTIDGVDESDFTRCTEDDATPLNLNAGAIGANGTFSSVLTANDEERKIRLATQRVVVGTWLLTKESCAALATVLTTQKSTPCRSQISKVGQLLISTLAALKHAGAAFAARDALQEIATYCMKDKALPMIYSLPNEWFTRLIDEISLSEKVRNSTLRRSTGYSLGFMAIMRGEIQTKRSASSTSISVLRKLLAFSLPPIEKIEKAYARLKLKAIVTSSVSEAQYEQRCRIHALNILRLLILDAPLSDITSIIAGDCIVSSVLGYSNPNWSIRNSSTMLFAALMLRVVDADKNAANNGNTSSIAITITELFRRFPKLSSFLLATLHICLEDMETTGQFRELSGKRCMSLKDCPREAKNFNGDTPQSQLFPVLLLLSRVQQISDWDATKAISKDFIPLLLRCVGSKDLYIRHASVRALVNLCPNSYSNELLIDLKHLLENNLACSSVDWNRLDGILLAINEVTKASKKLCPLSDIETPLLEIAQGDYPPMCRSNTLSIMLENEIAGDDALKLCHDVVTCGDIQFHIGGTHLLKTASTGICIESEHFIFKATDESSLERGLSVLRSLLTSPLIDVRIHAVKVFKKRIRANVDFLHKRSISTTVNFLDSDVILHRLCSLLLESSIIETERDDNDFAGAHVPTLRRLSRCFLRYHMVMAFDVSKDEAEMLWSLSCRIIAKDIGNEDVNPQTVAVEASGANVLSSNGAEMMAVSICAQTPVNPTRLRYLLKVISMLNDPICFWKSRYGAALALSRCCRREAIFRQNLCRYEIVTNLIKMMQDSDEDVRSVASNAATIFCKHGQIDCNTHLLPEWIMMQTFPNFFSEVSSESDFSSFQIETLLTVLLENCAQLETAIQGLKEEFGHTSKGYSVSPSHDNFVNDTSRRKIFEDEDPNPFHEKLLLNQLSVNSLIDLMIGKCNNAQIPSSSSIEVVLERCETTLALLSQLQSVGGFIHEVTRMPSVFPSLWGILACSAVVLQSQSLTGVNCNHVNDFTEKKDKIRIMARGDLIASPYVHPAIRSALNVMQEVTPSREATKSLLFLLDPRALESYN